MSRPTSGTDLKIKAAGRKLLQEKGLAGLTVRGACRLAGVNTGMFAYYFGSKEEFTKIILKEVYAEFMLKLRSETAVAGEPREKLKGALVELGKFARELRKALPLLLADLAYGKREAFLFFSGNFTEHIGHISALAQQCRPRSAVKEHSVPYIVGALLPVMVMPILMGGVMERNRVKSVGGVKLEDLLQEFFSDEGISGRAEIALRGVGL
jgi:AcrR family transcriptional regulator